MANAQGFSKPFQLADLNFCLVCHDCGHLASCQTPTAAVNGFNLHTKSGCPLRTKKAGQEWTPAICGKGLVRFKEDAALHDPLAVPQTPWVQELVISQLAESQDVLEAQPVPGGEAKHMSEADRGAWLEHHVEALQRRRENVEAALAGGQKHTWRQRPGSAGNAVGRAAGVLCPPWTPSDGQDATDADAAVDTLSAQQEQPQQPSPPDAPVVVAAPSGGAASSSSEPSKLPRVGGGLSRRRGCGERSSEPSAARSKSVGHSDAANTTDSDSGSERISDDDAEPGDGLTPPPSGAGAGATGTSGGASQRGRKRTASQGPTSRGRSVAKRRLVDIGSIPQAAGRGGRSGGTPGSGAGRGRGRGRGRGSRGGRDAVTTLERPRGTVAPPQLQGPWGHGGRGGRGGHGGRGGRGGHGGRNGRGGRGRVTQAADGDTAAAAQQDTRQRRGPGRPPGTASQRRAAAAAAASPQAASPQCTPQTRGRVMRSGSAAAAAPRPPLPPPRRQTRQQAGQRGGTDTLATLAAAAAAAPASTPLRPRAAANAPAAAAAGDADRAAARPQAAVPQRAAAPPQPAGANAALQQAVAAAAQQPGGSLAVVQLLSTVVTNGLNDSQRISTEGIKEWGQSVLAAALQHLQPAAP